MAELSFAERKELTKQLMAKWSEYRDEVPLSKVEFFRMIEDVDTGLNADELRMNQYIRAAIRSRLSTMPADKENKFKALVFMEVLGKRYDVVT